MNLNEADVFNKCDIKDLTLYQNQLDDSEEVSDELNFKNLHDSVNSSSNESLGPIRWDPLGAEQDTMTAGNQNLNDYLASSARKLPCDENSSSNLPVRKLNSLEENNEQCLGKLDESAFERQKLRSLEEEQEILTQSLMALTSHFAKVQFRLRQIVESPSQERDILLKNLEEFASRGIPEVDQAVGEFVSPLKMKEQLVAQLKTQITDLERFIAYLQCCENGAMSFHEFQSNLLPSWLKDKTNEKKLDAYNSYSAKKAAKSRSSSESSTPKPDSKTKTFSKFSNDKQPSTSKTFPLEDNKIRTDSINQKAHNLLDKASTVIQMFAATQFGASASFNRNLLKKTQCGNHWGDIRAQLEIDIQEIIGLAKAVEDMNHSSPTISNQKETNKEKAIGIQYSATKSIKRNCHLALNIELTTLVRKNFATTLQKLVQHGLHFNITANTANNLIVPFMGCFNASTLGSDQHSGYADYDLKYSSITNDRQMHAWELILEYYNLKNGDDYNSTPARKLSQSFNLEIISGNQLSNKESLLSCIGNIIQIHKPYKRSYNSHFKAFVCAALNEKKLVVWLSLILHCKELIESYYESWSYLVRTGFNDALHSIDLLTKNDFDLPIDLAIRQFENIKDVFM